MAFADAFHPKFKSDLKKIDKSIAKEIREKHLDIILNAPLEGELLKGKLSHIRSYHFKNKSTQYRIAYEVLEDKNIIFHYMVASRENFYKKLENRIS
jgi:addiction module RelE/StbE family toxin